MSLPIEAAGVKPIKLKQELDISYFHCERPEYEKYIKEEALLDQENGIGQAWIFYYAEHPIGYVSIATSQLEKMIDKKLSEIPNRRDTIPAVLIGQMARDDRYKHQGVGKIMISWVIRRAFELSEAMGCRLVIANAEAKAVKCYKEWGFAHIATNNPDENVMFFDLHWLKN